MGRDFEYGRQTHVCKDCPDRYRFCGKHITYDCHDHCQKYLAEVQARLHRPYGPEKLKGWRNNEHR